MEEKNNILFCTHVIYIITIIIIIISSTGMINNSQQSRRYWMDETQKVYEEKWDAQDKHDKELDELNYYYSERINNLEKQYDSWYDFSGPENISDEINFAHWDIPHCDKGTFPLGKFRCWVYYNEAELEDDKYTWTTSNDGTYKIVNSYEYGDW